MVSSSNFTDPQGALQQQFHAESLTRTGTDEKLGNRSASSISLKQHEAPPAQQQSKIQTQKYSTQRGRDAMVNQVKRTPRIDGWKSNFHCGKSLKHSKTEVQFQRALSDYTVTSVKSREQGHRVRAFKHGDCPASPRSPMRESKSRNLEVQGNEEMPEETSVSDEVSVYSTSDARDHFSRHGCSGKNRWRTGLSASSPSLMSLLPVQESGPTVTGNIALAREPQHLQHRPSSEKNKALAPKQVQGSPSAQKATQAKQLSMSSVEVPSFIKSHMECTAVKAEDLVDMDKKMVQSQNPLTPFFKEILILEKKVREIEKLKEMQVEVLSNALGKRQEDKIERAGAACKNLSVEVNTIPCISKEAIASLFSERSKPKNKAHGVSEVTC
jgi:hypothetical protein